MQQGRQCTYKRNSEVVHAAIFAVEKQKVLHILSVCVCVFVCSFSHPACNAHVPYCHLWPAPL